ncbi:twocomponent response regulator [Bradyrhizobium sp.]|uniref:response regulator n=1 Tax=Bradyrhizobium sp. TaxID=376 RepID=UPI0007C1D967|nr:response regulator [Bradyrhizobium sp.]CUT12641.1 twocomponent response regulator [Bradyrhizobium sp.]
MTLMGLVVDDEPDIEPPSRQQFRRDVRARRFDMDFARWAKQARRRVVEAGERRLVPILSGTHMPGMSGPDMLPRMRARRPDGPIITILAYGDNRTHETALEQRADDRLINPIDFVRLIYDVETRLGTVA